jgi:hypothetical protein
LDVEMRSHLICNDGLVRHAINSNAPLESVDSYGSALRSFQVGGV